MDEFHDILTLPGSASLGVNKQNNGGAQQLRHSQSTNNLRNDGGLLDPLRRLLRPSLQTLGALYRNGKPTPGTPPQAPTDNYRIQLLRLKITQVGVLRCIDTRVTR